MKHFLRLSLLYSPLQVKNVQITHGARHGGGEGGLVLRRKLHCKLCGEFFWQQCGQQVVVFGELQEDWLEEAWREERGAGEQAVVGETNLIIC